MFQLLLLLQLFVGSFSKLEPLIFGDDGTFKLVQFTDMNINGSIHCTSVTQQLMRSILENEKPDFVMITGDAMDNARWYHEQRYFLNQSFTPIVESGVAWGYVLGNHESHGKMKRTEIVEYSLEFPRIYTTLGPEELYGASNSLIRVFSHSATKFGENDPAAMLFWVFDSGHHGDCYTGEKDRFFGICEDTIKWYQKKSDEQIVINKGAVPSSAYHHHPLCQHYYAWNNDTVYGTKEDNVDCFNETGLYDAFMKQGDVVFSTVGHDHANDFYGLLSPERKYYPIFGRKSGLGGASSRGLEIGARVFKFYEGGKYFR